MDINQLSDEEVAFAARALSIHRASIRRKLGRLTPDTVEYRQALVELKLAQQMVDKLSSADLQRITAA